MEMTHTKPNTEWPVRPIGELLRRVRRPVDLQLGHTYQEIGIRSHCKGIFHKTPTTGEEIGNKRVFWVEPGCLIYNIIFAWEQAVAMTSENEAAMIASHRFPMYTSRNGKLLPESTLGGTSRRLGVNTILESRPQAVQGGTRPWGKRSSINSRFPFHL